MEKLTAIEVAFVEWVYAANEWHFDEKIGEWVRDGYRSRTTNELFTYYQERVYQG